MFTHICCNFNFLNFVNSDIQINNVEPVLDERKEHLFRKPITEQILRHYR